MPNTVEFRHKENVDEFRHKENADELKTLTTAYFKLRLKSIQYSTL
jgi:hypothetical protein